ncbi:MAG: 4Fe-4S binding protein [Desulfobacterales bacterium]|nr:4Fe-4S binding protein [Desulfobacterales bacterium]MBT7696490.1 4Fe-4S binding protein [Desulfobacterales bacterium]
MDTSNDIYRKLQKHIDNNMPVGLPESKSGLDIKLLKHIFTPEDAEIALELSALPEPLERIHKRLKRKGIPIEELEQTLDKLVKKGAILDCKHFVKKGKGKYYSKAMMVVGMFELQAEKLTKEYAKDFMDYLKEGFYREVFSKKTSQMRTIPINLSVTPENNIDTYDNIKEIVKNSTGQIAALHCVCRESKDLLEDPCKQSDIRETCLLFEGSASMILDMGRARCISKEEALGILEKAETAGFILQPSNSQKPQFVCCCCGCCCEALGSFKMFPRPVEYFHSNYQSEIDSDMCSGCEECIEICSMEALALVDDFSTVDPDRCIGCGVCVPKCPSDAITLKNKVNKFIPPKDHDSMYQKILLERIGMLGMLKVIPKAILGKKI